MTNDEILQAAKEAGFNYAYASMWQDELEHLAAIIEKRTIERCAVVAEELRHTDGFSCENVDWCAGTYHAAAAIRKFGEQE